MKNDAELYLDLHKNLKEYFHATLRKDWTVAYKASSSIVDLAQKLEEFACDMTKQLAVVNTKEAKNDNRTKSSGNSSGFDGGNPKAT